MLCTASPWLRDNDPAGLTARQLPIEGAHSKWLNQNRKLPLPCPAARHPPLGRTDCHIHYTYLDPAHRAAGRRWHDSHTLGDSSQPLYAPTIAVISEHEDTAQLFPPVAGGISAHGNGFAAVAQLPAARWLAEVPALFYWGDLDGRLSIRVRCVEQERIPLEVARAELLGLLV